MTGAFDRLRAWLGGVFGGGAADGDDADTDAGDPTPESEGRVVHRDDRPLETPGTMDRTTPPTASGTDSDDGRDVDVPDAADGAPSGAATATPDTVAIPDAEADASTGDDPSAVDGRAGPAGVDSEERSSSGNRAEPGDSVEHGSTSGRPQADDRSRTVADAGDEDAAFACSVCGTAVDDPSEPCPLCGSTDVVPTDGASDAGTPARGGRTTVSTEGDDEAVDRLRDVTDEG